MGITHHNHICKSNVLLIELCNSELVRYFPLSELRYFHNHRNYCPNGNFKKMGRVYYEQRFD